MMNRTLLRAGFVAALALLGTMATTAPAAAAAANGVSFGAARADDQTLPGLKTALTARIDQRLASLQVDLAVIDAARHLTDGHRGELSTVVNEAIAGLTQLRGEVADETTIEGLRAAATSMVADYRVYLLVGPQVRLTIAGDAAAAAFDRAQQAHDKLAEKVAQAKADGQDTTAAETDLAQMQAAIDSGRGRLDGQVEAILALSPGPDGASIGNSVAAVRQALTLVRADVRTVIAEGRAVVDFLR
jgi:hypothetical protein